MNYEWNGKQYEVGYFFMDPITYVVTVEIEPGQFEYVTEALGNGRVLVCFVSLADAHIEGMLRAKPGLQYHVMEARSLPPRLFLNSEGGLFAMLHLAWGVAEGRMILCEDGAPRRFGGPLTKPIGDHGPITFNVNATALGTLDRIYEQAGLFAWCDTCEWMRTTWNLSRLQTVARQAIRLASAVAWPNGMGETDAALFDVEFGQWHVVSREVAEDMPMDDGA